MGLYRTAIEAGLVPAAMHWRTTLVVYLQNRDGNNCGICHKTMTFGTTTGPRGNDPQGATIDHITPRSKGGSDDLTNLRLAHWTCNRARGNRDITTSQLLLIG